MQGFGASLPLSVAHTCITVNGNTIITLFHALEQTLAPTFGE